MAICKVGEHSIKRRCLEFERALYIVEKKKVMVVQEVLNLVI